MTCLFFVSCDRKPEPQQPEVVLYTSADPDILRQVTEAFEKETGIKVRSVGDTEATKTTGLVQRLIAEKEHPRADVWWSSEAMGTIQLAGAGLLEPYTSVTAEKDAGAGGWPAPMRGRNKDWYGFARRTRVLVYNTNKIKEGDAPRNLVGLADPKYKGRVGMARPQFGTTRGHMAALLHAHGEPLFTDWLKAMKTNDLRLYDGNASVVRAVNTGEIDLGLTDNDDVVGGVRNHWPVAMLPVGNQLIAVSHERRGDRAFAAARGFPSGSLQTPCTVAVIKGAPHAEAAHRLLDFLISPRVEWLLAESEWSTLPVNPEAFDPEVERHGEHKLTHGETLYSPIADLDLEAVAAKAGDAIRICEQILGR